MDKLYLIEQLINCPSKKQKKLNEKYDRFIFKIENNPNQFYTLNLIDRLNEVYYFEILSKIMMSCKYLFNKIVFEGITTYNNYDPNCFSKMNFNGDETTLKYNKLYFFRRNNIIFTRNKTLLNYDIKEESFTLREVAREVCGNDTNNRVFIWPEELTLFNNIKWIFKDYEEIFKLMSEYNFDINFDNELPQNIFIKEYYNDAIYNVWKLIK